MNTTTPRRPPNLRIIEGGARTSTNTPATQNSQPPTNLQILRRIMANRSDAEISNPTRDVTCPTLALMVAWLGEVRRSNDTDAVAAYEVLRRIPSFDEFVQKYLTEARPYFTR
ncbi:hypothetical protein [Desulfurivibrio alkaliphilus]|uniref:Uncharacterized protein n=1 Tax=Desulfurivibrio alkaliphilus (strain DSM 19089 / UNIQEM U267 / AHT2) TaxID=589865 RepID=D6Z5I5_DESAT|nr:hypothetical protein [Desulfurivibrio alkaliphilus]ADH86722.1 hypothetical protein DaAHT2_2048 [Desulfurivibrio alkaliphilus AHT 2]